MFFHSILPQSDNVKVKILVSTNRKQTNFYWYLPKGFWISGLRSQTCSSTATCRTQVCTYLDCPIFVLFNLNNLLHSFDVYYSGFDFRRNLPVDLAEGVLRALSLQALGQVSMFLLRRLIKCHLYHCSSMAKNYSASLTWKFI